MMKNKELRKHNQNMIYMIITLTELLIDVFYLFLVFWRKDVPYVCSIVFFLYTAGRHNVILHLLYLCVERLCAVNMSLNKIFRRMIKKKSRLIFSGISLAVSCLLFLPTIVTFGKLVSHSCGPDMLFEENAGLILRINRAIFSVEIIVIFIIYLYLVKRINILSRIVHPENVPPINNTEQTTHATSSRNTEKTTVTEMKVIPTTSSTTAERQKPKSKATFNEKSSTAVKSDDKQKQPSQDHVQSVQTKSRKWKLKTFKMLSYSILVIVLPSIPMLVMQLVTAIQPSLRNPFTDLIISLCNILHAIIYPLVFVIHVKHCKCQRR